MCHELQSSGLVVSFCGTPVHTSITNLALLEQAEWQTLVDLPALGRVKENLLITGVCGANLGISSANLVCSNLICRLTKQFKRLVRLFFLPYNGMSPMLCAQTQM